MAGNPLWFQSTADDPVNFHVAALASSAKFAGKPGASGFAGVKSWP